MISAMFTLIFVVLGSHIILKANNSDKLPCHSQLFQGEDYKYLNSLFWLVTRSALTLGPILVALYFFRKKVDESKRHQS